MKTSVLQLFFKIALLLSGMAIGFGCDDSSGSDDPDNWAQEGMEISCTLAKTVENGTEVKYPTEISPSLTLKKDLTFEGDAVCNSIKGGYKYNADNGRFIIEGLITTELACISPYSEAESMYLGYLGKISSFKQEGESIKLYFGEDSYLEYKVQI
ncbi:MAG: META domain-containing protein [Parabacteroides johnsonii]|nr:META domain-containing protein [Parabacteroides johnsonii]